jgi:hypothetical protein
VHLADYLRFVAENFQVKLSRSTASRYLEETGFHSRMVHSKAAGFKLDVAAECKMMLNWVNGHGEQFNRQRTRPRPTICGAQQLCGEARANVRAWPWHASCRNSMRSNRVDESKMDPMNPAVLRNQAEEIVLQQEGQRTETLTPEEMQQTLHNLSVHQVELEMQNEELRRVHVELEAVRARLYDLYDLAPVGYCPQRRVAGAGGQTHRRHPAGRGPECARRGEIQPVHPQ